MFDVTPDDINQLNDSDLRELVGRLCEAELSNRGLSPAAVTWGGNQTAADGGLDVRVELPLGTSIEGFIPCSATGFQVKKPDMPRAEIIAEMRPEDTIRSVIQELADEAGAYIIVSSTGSTADRRLRDRRNAMREALGDVTNADQLRTDFYDRTRLATWVRLYPGLITWVKERVGSAFDGWRPYASWSGVAENIDAEYLLDEKLRLHLGGGQNAPAQSVAQAIDELRDELIQPGKIVRLVGLSGVGKTRLAQALFDARIGTRPLPPFLAVYTNLSDNPDPQPTGLASDLIANRMRAVLIIDNCPPELHRRLTELCSGQNSTVSVLTVEYDGLCRVGRTVVAQPFYRHRWRIQTEALLHGLQHHVLHVVTPIAIGAGYPTHDFPVTTVQRKRDPELITIVTVHLETIGAPASVAGRHGDTTLVPAWHPRLLHPATQQ